MHSCLLDRPLSSAMMGPDQKLPENPLAISWHDSNWIPVLTPHNVMDYFSERSNPFYDRTCNNEVLKMQRASPDQLHNMTGVEFCLLHVQDPILYVVRKQHRHSPQHVTPIADYYIVAGTVYQAPDLGSVLNSRLISTVNHLGAAFEEARQYATYHPSRGYWWDFEKKGRRRGPGGPTLVPSMVEEKAREEMAAAAAAAAGGKGKQKGKSGKSGKAAAAASKKAAEKRAREEPGSLFQRRRVDMILDLLTRKFPPPRMPSASAAGSAAQDSAAAPQGKGEAKETEVGASSSSSALKTEKEVKTEPSSSASSAAGIKREASGQGLATGAKKLRTT